MSEEVLLLVDLLEESKGITKVRTYLDDNSEVFFAVPTIQITTIENFKPPRGWLKVQYSGEVNKRASITLPAPILNMGHNITVSTSRIMRQSGTSSIKQPKSPVILPKTKRPRKNKK